MAIKHCFHGNSLFSSSHPLDFNMLVTFILENVKQGDKLKLTFYMLVGSCIWGTILKFENRMPKVARKAFNIGEVWNPVCFCHGNRIVKLKLWSTFGRVLLQRIKHCWYKLAEISFFHHICQIWLSLWRHHLANLHI